MPSPVEEVLGEYADTQARWSVLVAGARVYSEQRSALHEQLLSQAFTGRPAGRGTTPTVLVLAGGPASGKSTLLKALDVPDPHTTIDPDAFKPGIPEYARLVAMAEPEAAAVVHEESSDLAAELLRRAMAARHDLVVDQVGDGPTGRFASKLDGFVRAGYAVDVVYADVPIELALERAQQRFRKSGRMVQEAVVRQLHAEVARRYHEVVDEPNLRSVLLYDCSMRRPRLVAETRAGSPPATVVHRPDTLRAFLMKGLP